MATTVAQLYLTNEPDHKIWKKEVTAGLCLVDDMQRNSNYIQFYNLSVSLKKCLFLIFNFEFLIKELHAFVGARALYTV